MSDIIFRMTKMKQNPKRHHMKYLLKKFESSVAGIPMMARVVRPGEGMGQWDDKKNEFMSSNKTDELLVDFYDTRYAENKKGPIVGQFISRYHLSTLQEDGQSNGLCLDGNFKNEWSIGAKEFKEVVDWAEGLRQKMDVKKGKPLDFDSHLGM